MVLNIGIALRIAQASADACQPSARDQNRLTTPQLLDLFCCFPLHHLGRVILCVWTYLCVSPPDSYYSYSYSDEDDGSGSGGGDSYDSSSTVDYVDLDYASHSD